MTTPTNPIAPFTPFLPSFVQIPEDDERRRTYLQEKLSQYSDVINDKKIGAYTQNAESQNGEKWVYLTTKKLRNGFQAIAYIPSFPNAGMLTLDATSEPRFPLTNVNPQFVVTDVWGSASRPCTAVGAGDGDYFSFYSEGNSKVTFTMSDTQIIIVTTVDLTAYSGFIVIEYLRDGV